MEVDEAGVEESEAGVEESEAGVEEFEAFLGIIWKFEKIFNELR